MKTTINALVVVILLLVSAGCMRSPESAAGFRLPDGDAEFGQQAFLDLQCNACHTIPGVELPSIDISAPVSVALGGPVALVKTYGQLVTSIINPSHRLSSRYPKEEISADGESFMPTMNELMTVRQLVDLVAFLQIQYEVLVPSGYPYPVYKY